MTFWNLADAQDAAFLLPQGHGPLHSTSPADIYLLLKSSDFVQHDLDPPRAYEGVDSSEVPAAAEVKIELVLKKFEDMNPSREVRCFVRDDILLGISQRDTNFYEHYQSSEDQAKLVERVKEFYEDEIRENYAGGPNCECRSELLSFENGEGLELTNSHIRPLPRRPQDPRNRLPAVPREHGLVVVQLR